jgi:hypothetical protein
MGWDGIEWRVRRWSVAALLHFCFPLPCNLRSCNADSKLPEWALQGPHTCTPETELAPSMLLGCSVGLSAPMALEREGLAKIMSPVVAECLITELR